MIEKINPKSKNNVVAALLPYPPQLGEVTELCDPILDSKYELKWMAKIGQEVDPHSLADVAGMLFLFNDDKEKLRKDFESLANYQPVKTKPIEKNRKVITEYRNNYAVMVAISAAFGGLAYIALCAVRQTVKIKPISLFNLTSFSALIGLFAYKNHKINSDCGSVKGFKSRS